MGSAEGADESGCTPTLGQPWPRSHPDPPDQVLCVRRRARCGRWDFSGIFGREASGVREANVHPKDVEPSPVAGPTRIRCVHRFRQDQDRGAHSELQLLAVTRPGLDVRDHFYAAGGASRQSVRSWDAASPQSIRTRPPSGCARLGRRPCTRARTVHGTAAVRPAGQGADCGLRCRKGQRRHFK